MNHTYLEQTVEYTVTYKNRKSIGIYIDYYGTVEVRAPKKTSIEQIVGAMESQWRGILEKSAQMKARLSGPQEKVYDQGEEFLYLGKNYPIVIVENSEGKQDFAQIENDTLRVYVKEMTETAVPTALKRFYYKECKSLITKRIGANQCHFRMKPRSFRISDNQKTWGTCNSNREMTFNWKLAMAPVEVIDYIVVHEMCHMVHLNHDRSFWRLVGKITPDYQQCSNWLALSGWQMNL